MTIDIVSISHKTNPFLSFLKLSPKDHIVKQWGFIYNSKSEEGVSPQDSPKDGWLVYLQHLSQEIQQKYGAGVDGWAHDNTFEIKAMSL